MLRASDYYDRKGVDLFAAIVLRSTTNTLFYYALFLIITELFFSQKSLLNSFVILSNTIFAADK